MITFSQPWLIAYNVSTFCIDRPGRIVYFPWIDACP
jgi:hypothetical protein